MAHLGPVPSDYKKPRAVYRCFKEAAHADDLARGKVWLSTLKACREYDNPLQGDPLEATNHYFSGPPISIDEPNGREIARRSGIFINANSKGGTIAYNTRTTRIDDAFVICTTATANAEGLEEIFGQHVVEIQNPRRFLHRVNTALSLIMPMKNRAMAPIEYTEPLTIGMDEMLPLGFIKRPLYAEQNEFRLMWFPESAIEVKPRLIDVPRVAGQCRRVR